MTFGRWLLIHSFSIFLVSLMILGYYFREELQLEQAYQQLLNLDDKTLSRTVEPEKDQTQPAKNESVESQPESIVSREQQTSVSDQKEVVFIESQPTVSEVIIEQDELLFQARKAYWDKDYQKAIASYQQLIQKEKDNADYLGELGNIYYALNDFPNAARHYYQAAMALIKNNQYEHARQLVSPVTAMNRELGEELKRKLMQ